jgi:hypothetical protein
MVGLGELGIEIQVWRPAFLVIRAAGMTNVERLSCEFMYEKISRLRLEPEKFSGSTKMYFKRFVGLQRD